MTGRIEMLATAISAGRITTTTGVNTFHYAYRVPLGNTEGLSVGGLVTFQLERGNPNMAISVCADQVPAEAVPSGRAEVRYQGFEQTHTIRSFKFQTWRTGEENQEAVVTADLALFRKHGVTIQEGPGLCLRLVESELQQANPSGPHGVWKRALTDKELMEHVACRRTSGRRH